MRLEDVERLYSKSWSGSTSLGGFAREIAAWLGYVDPKNNTGQIIQRIAKGMLRATETWPDRRHAEDDKFVELDSELAVALASVTEGATRSIVLRVRGMASARDGYAPKSSNDPTVAPQPILARHTRCKDARELKEKLTAWSLKMTVNEHHFKAIDAAKKTFVVREMMPKDIKRKFLMGPRKFDEIMEKVGDHHQRNDGRRPTIANGSEECRYTRCENDAE